MEKQKYNSDIDKRYISLAKVKGSAIKEVVGYISTEFGDPCFKLSRIYFEDGTDCWCEGEHDMPYVTDLDEDILNQLNDEEE